MKLQFTPETLDQIQKFLSRLSQDPRDGIIKTPDGKAMSLAISHVETTLDEFFFGHWRTQNFQWHQIGNEIQASIELVVIHPITAFEITRVGAGSVVIMVDKVPDEIAHDRQLRNRWALNPENKKSNALDLAFPKLKAECLKNAALSLGKIFGRDMNRQIVDDYKPFKINLTSLALKALPESTLAIIERQITDGMTPWEFNKQIESLSELISDDQKKHLENLFYLQNPDAQ